MEFTSISLQDFRNIPIAQLDLVGCRHFFLGPNGQGKSNLLEALGLVTALRSFRTRDFRALTRKGADGFSALFTMESETNGGSSLEVRVQGSAKRLLLDGEPMGRLGALLGCFPSVVLSSADLQLLRGAPMDRRRWLDLVLASSDQEYFAALNAYSRALAGRNRLLKVRGSVAELSAFEVAMLEPALSIVQIRTQAVAHLAKHFTLIYDVLSGGGEEADLRYRSALEGVKASEVLKKWQMDRERDRLLGSTQFGPHRDDLVLRLEGRVAREYGSDGQQRGLVLAMRLAQARYLEDRLKMLPVLLADDVLGELDPVRREAFWSVCRTNSQMIATGTELPPRSEQWIVWKVENGAFSKMPMPQMVP